MKKQAVIGILLSLVLVLPAMADSRSQVTQKAINYVTQLEAKGWTIIDEVGYLDDIWVGQSMQIDRTLSSGLQYIFVAFGDDDATDVDVYIYDEHWNLISKDADSSNLAVAKAAPSWTGLFHIVVKLYSSHASWSTVGVVGGYYEY